MLVASTTKHILPRCSLCILLAVAATPLSLTSAAIVQNGNVRPDVTLWTNLIGYGIIGDVADGRVDVDGSSDLLSRDTFLGFTGTSKGTLAVSGVGSLFLSGSDLYVGEYGSGQVSVLDGGQILSNGVFVGNRTNSSGEILINNAKWRNEGQLYVGHNGNGKLNVSNGGSIETGWMFASLSDLSGNGLIVSKYGAVLDAEMAFSASTGYSQQLAFGSGGILNLSIDWGVLGSGYRTAGSLTISEGVNINTTVGYLGYHVGAYGVARVVGPSSTWNSSYDLFVGREGEGVVAIEAGASLQTGGDGSVGSLLGSKGSISIVGRDSTWHVAQTTTIGKVGNGTLSVSEGGRVSSGTFGYENRHATVGEAADSNGIVFVKGEGSKWDIVYNLNVGYYGDGSVSIETGGVVASDRAYLGYYKGASGTALVRGTGAKFESRTDLYIGREGTGSLSVEAGGVADSDLCYVGYGASADGALSVVGEGARFTAKRLLAVGWEGNATLTVADGGVVEVGTLFAARPALRGNGTIIATEGAYLDADLRFDATHPTQAVTAFGSGGILKVSASDGPLCIGYRGEGSLTIMDGAVVPTSHGYIGYEPISNGVAKVLGLGSEWKISDSLRVGYLGSGELLVESGARVTSPAGYLGGYGNGRAKVSGAESRWLNSGDLVISQNNSTLEITAGGLVAVGGRLSIIWNASGSGAVNIATGGMLAIRGYAHDSITSFLGLFGGRDSVRYWNADLSEWTSIRSAVFLQDYTLNYISTGSLSGYTVLTVGGIADINNDREVDGMDFLHWQRNPELGSLADWKDSFGTTRNFQSSALHVPEPSFAAIGGLAIAFGTIAARRGFFA